jgi:hypothetical protein
MSSNYSRSSSREIVVTLLAKEYAVDPTANNANTLRLLYFQ